MAVPEIFRKTETAQYQEPGPFDYRVISIYEKVPDGWRMSAIFGQIVQIEPEQEDVKRYPPVQVDVPRNREYIKQYINMGPSKNY
jgi:hypothetical protein